MKRPNCDEGNPVKKQRKNLASDVFDDDSLNNCFCNVDSLTSAIGYFTGSIDMLWSHIPNKFMFNLVARCCITDKQSHKIYVTLEGDWIKPMEAKWGPICIMDQIQLSLDGITFLKPKDSKSTAKLIYKEGVIFRRSRKADLCFVNTWQLQEEQRVQDDFNDWFATPVSPASGHLSVAAGRASGGGSGIAPTKERDTTTTPSEQTGRVTFQAQFPGCNKTPTTMERVTMPSRSDPERVDVVGQQTSTTTLKPTTAQPIEAPVTRAHAVEEMPRAPPPPKSRRAQKKERKKRRAAELAATKAAGHLLTHVDQPTMPQPVVGFLGAIAASQPSVPALASTSTSKGPQVVKLSQIGMGNIAEDTPEGWMTQLRNSQLRYQYVALKEATQMRSYVSVIGIVKNFRGPSKTTTGEWTATVYLQDPSLCQEAESYSWQDFSVVFFQKRFMEWLPQVKPGDILILRHVRLQSRAGTISGVGYHDRAQWATYSTDQRCIVQPETGSAPKDQELVDGGVRFTPFLRVTEMEERYCQRLSEWWKEKLGGAAESTGQVYQLGDDIFSSGQRTYRKRLLLCDAGPHVEPSGYFDCTFEVLSGFQNDYGAYSLYVTDYTINPGVAPCHAQWCPPGLNDYVARFELWDGAAKEARLFKVGTYWSVRNARMVRSRSGYAEGKLVETKFRQVDPEIDYPPLNALLERKKEWEKQIERRRDASAHKLFKDSQDGQYITCTVELLHTTKSGPNGVFLHVTDYTAHPKLLSYRYGREWSQGLEGRIISILLRDAQVQYADSLRVGTNLTIKSLRLRDSNITHRFQGELGGQDLLMCQLNPKNPNNDLRALLERKTEWEKGRENGRTIRELKELNASEFTTAINSTIKELNAGANKPLKARVIARVIDYHPRSPAQWIRTWCSKCKQRIPEEKRACYQCQDFSHAHIRYQFELMLRIEDRKGDRMYVLVRDECDLLHGLARDASARSSTVLSEYIRRLQPLLGNTCGNQLQFGPEKERELANDFVKLIIGRYQGVSHGTPCILLAVEK